MEAKYAIKSNIKTIVFAVTATLSLFLILLKASQSNVSNDETFKIKGQVQSTAQSGGPVKFLFIMGLEGTGHHFMTQLIDNSPNKMLFDELNITRSIKEMAQQLFKRHTPLFRLVELSDRADVLGAQKRLSKKMEEVASLVSGWKKNNTDSRTDTINIPLNCIQAQGFMMSYPFLGGRWREQHIPSLGLFYGACQMANVDCGHVYLHRSPSQILRSTTEKRGFNQDFLHGMHLYTMILKTIIVDLTRHAATTEACVGFYDNDSTVWKSAIRSLWGWDTTNKDDFATYIGHAYKKPNATDVPLKLPDNLEPLVRLFVEENERAKRVCEHALKLHKEHN